MKLPTNRGGLRFYLLIVSAVVAAWHATAASVAAGSLLVAVGIFIHVWAKGCLHQNAEVTNTGPYRFVRHPFYTANLFIDAGVAAMSGWWLVWIAFPIWWFAVYIPVIRGEESFLRTKFHGSYDEYARRIWMLLPLSRPLPKTGPEFSWSNRNISHGREIPRALHIASYPLLFLLICLSRVEGWRKMLDRQPTVLPIVASIILLVFLSWQLSRSLKFEKRLLPAFFANLHVRILAAGLFAALAVLVPYARIQVRYLLIPLGVLILAFSLVVYLKRATLLFLAECLALVGICVICEVLWLAPLPILFYAAIFLDSRLPAPASIEAAPALPATAVLLQRALYFVILAGSLVAAAAKAFFPA